MAWALKGVGFDASTVGATSLAVTLTGGNAPAVGDLITVLIAIAATESISSVTDDQGNSYTARATFQASTKTVSAWTATAGTAATTIITVTIGSSQAFQLHAGAWGGGPSSLTYSNATGSSTTTTHPCGSVSGVNGDLLLTVSRVDTGFAPTVNADYTQFRSTNRTYSQFKVLSGSFSSDAAWTSGVAENVTSLQLRITETITDNPFFTQVGAIYQ